MPQGGKLKITGMTVLLAVVASLTIVLPIVVGILAAEIYSEELLAAGAGWQLSILITALVVLVVIQLYTLSHTVGFRKH